MSKQARSVHLGDVENLAGGPARLADRSDLGDQYREVVRPAGDDLFVIGSDITNVFYGAASFPGARLVTGRGPSGADHALMASNSLGWLVDRVDTVVIGSGDGDFALFARACREAGLRVVVVARRSAVGSALLANADAFIPFPETGAGEAAAAALAVAA